MRTPDFIFIVLFVCCVIRLEAQREVPLNKTSPFTAVKWESELPKVQFQGEWYDFEKIEDWTTKEIIAFSQHNYASEWKSRFAEDLIEIIEKMGFKPKSKVKLQLSRNGESKIYIGIATADNRSKLIDYVDEQKDLLEQAFTGYLSKERILEDLYHLANHIENYSSYQGWNGFDYKLALEEYKKTLPDSILNRNFGVFLRNLIGQIGDRHAYVHNYKMPNGLFMPFAAAPLDDKVVALEMNTKDTLYELLYADYPYLSAIDGIAIQAFLEKIAQSEIKAPTSAFQTIALWQLPLMELNFAILDRPLPEKLAFTFSNGKMDTIVYKALTSSRKEYPLWREKFAHFYGQEKEDLNDQVLCDQLFHIRKDGIAIGRLPDMVDPEDAPIFYKSFTHFMGQAQQSEALILDVRSNDGGTRDLLWKLNEYLIHPDSVYVVNVAQQRAQIPLGEGLKSGLHNRQLLAMHELNDRQRARAVEFMKTFNPIYKLPGDKYSEPYFFVIDGKMPKSADTYHYDRPVYLLVNEECFSASSILVAVLKGLPNITVAGINTDGSSGNSEVIYLPNSHISVKISTMVSFQKDGKILDGYGTAPDIEIERDLDQVLWRRDTQLEKLIEKVKAQLNQKK